MPHNQKAPISSTVELTSVSPYFAPLLPWQVGLWHNLTSKALADNNKLAHAFLAGGMKGIGKRNFIWRWVAWQLCLNRHHSLHGACQNCDSCNWLQASSHPDLQVLPITSLPAQDLHTDTTNTTTTKTKNNKKSASKDINNRIIKIDDIRGIQNFIHQGSHGLRICVFDHAETMTISAANALLKTLEEPQQGIQLILITDSPHSLLPTIKSRVQQLPLTQIDTDKGFSYVQQQLKHLALSKYQQQSDNPNYNQQQIAQLLRLSSNAPLQAVKIAQERWYTMRQLWLNTWLALRTGKRCATTASDYWQTQLSLADFLILTQIMLADLLRLLSGLPLYQQDLEIGSINEGSVPNALKIETILMVIKEIRQGLKQNVQEKLAYDMLIQSLVLL